MQREMKPIIKPKDWKKRQQRIGVLIHITFGLLAALCGCVYDPA